jgi:hypothetical protein
LSKEGEEEGGEEENNPFERWYLEKRRCNNKDCIHRYRQRKVVESIPSCMVADSIPTIGLDVYFITRQE